MTAWDWILLFVVWEGWWLYIYILVDMARFALADMEPTQYIGNKRDGLDG